MTSWVFFFLLLQTALITRSSSADDTSGFISIDCGIPDGYSYIDDNNKLQYVSDSKYIDAGAGSNYNISVSDPTILRQEKTLRSFPDGERNCYTLPAEKSTKYLVRAIFLHGNYDGSGISPDKPVLFNLYLGVNLWQSVNISDPFFVYRKAAAITVALDYYISVCLVKSDGTPFISSLELRPLGAYMYPNATERVALVTYERFNYGANNSEQLIRYPNDRYDRLWWPAPRDAAPVGEWIPIQTSQGVQSHDHDMFMVPTAVLQTAVVPADNNSQVLQFVWSPSVDESVIPQVHLIMHFAEIELQLPQVRQFDVYLNDRLQQDKVKPEYLISNNVHTTDPDNQNRYNFSFRKTADSTFPPILNALEIYSVLQLTEIATNPDDVDAIGKVKQQYKVKKNWVGDPCSPRKYRWEGLECDDTSEPPKILKMNLSYSGLNGTIDLSFVGLKAVTSLDLSYNNLTGNIPDFLAELPSLQLLDLTSNQLSGPIPKALLEKRQKESFVLRTDGNPDLCADGVSCPIAPKSRTKLTTAVISILCMVSVILVLLMTILCRMLRKPQGIRKYVKSLYGGRSMLGMTHNDDSLQLENRQFTYIELKNITNNFEKVLGKGGFGTVYHGSFQDNTQVAVKIRSQLSSQGVKEFLAEAQHLTRVHHKNLVSIIGYCKDGDYLALVYEYMSNGTLKEHLRGKIHNERLLSWGQRLQIAIDAAQGLEYLHKMCWPPLIHRDVKTENILLNERLVAKLADFGLSKAFQSEFDSHISSKVVGTPGYVDPEYYSTFRLSEKSDVYSFGVILLELITGKPPVFEDLGNLHITQYVRRELALGNIEDIVDPLLQGEYDINSVWKCAEIALNCTLERAYQRPNMACVMIQLKEILELVTPLNKADDDGDISTGRDNLFGEARFICPNNVHPASGVYACSCEPSVR